MTSQILRPTGPGNRKHQRPWVIQGSWGRRVYPASTRTELYDRLHEELIESGQLDKNALRPTRRYHSEVAGLIMDSSYVNGHWIDDDPRGRGD
jgi:hypothetical protein